MLVCCFYCSLKGVKITVCHYSLAPIILYLLLVGPQPAGNIRIQRESDEIVRVSWEPSATKVDGYFVTVTGDSVNLSFNVTGGGNSVNLTTLSTEGEYTVIITSHIDGVEGSSIQQSFTFTEAGRFL